MATYKELLAEYHKLAKRADERLRSLERASGREGYKGVTRYAYARAQYDIRAFTGDPDKAFGRFDVNPRGATTKERADMLRTMMASVKTFLNSETSSIGRAKGADGQWIEGIRGSYKQTAETTNERYGTDFTWQQMATYWLSGLGEKMNQKYGSKTAMAKVAENPKRAANIIREINRANQRGQMISDAQLDVMIDAAFGGDPSIDDL